jgi:hypothetical protein
VKLLFPERQFGDGGPLTQTPFEHASTVQPSPLLQGFVLLVCVQMPVAESQPSVVHTLLSLQRVA